MPQKDFYYFSETVINPLWSEGINVGWMVWLRRKEMRWKSCKKWYGKIRWDEETKEKKRKKNEKAHQTA